MSLTPDIDINAYVSAALIILLSALCAMDTISSVSISLEGKAIWNLQSAPVDPLSVLIAKALAHIVLCLPVSIISSVIFIIVFKPSLLFSLLLIISPALMTVFQGFLGIWANLKFPKLDWDNETAVIKQSISVMVAMFCPIAVVAAPTAVYTAFGLSVITPEVFIMLFTLFVMLLIASMYIYFLKRGRKIFEQL